LASAIESCLRREPPERPTFADLATTLGPPTRSGAAAVARLLRDPRSPWRAARRVSAARRKARSSPPWLAPAAALGVGAIISLAALWIRGPADGAPPAIAATERIRPIAAAPGPAEAVAQTEPNRPLRDPHVRPAAAQRPAPVANELVLDTGALAKIDAGALRPGMRVRGRGGRRAVVELDRGLVLAVEDVSFEGIDFVFRPAGGKSGAPQALIEWQAQAVAFRRCTFSAAAGEPPVAVRHAGGSRQNLPGLAAEVAFADCTFAGLASIVDCRLGGSLSVTLANALCVEAGPAVRLARAPAGGEQIEITLEHVTVRGDGGVLECRFDRLDAPLGTIAITARDSVLAGPADTPLIALAGRKSPEALVAAIAWSGQGSIVVPETPLLAWRSGGRRLQVLAEEELNVAGLVRSPVEFAGPPGGSPAASRATHWQVPLRSDQPPGANVDAVPAAGWRTAPVVRARLRARTIRPGPQA
jgi:hypothetical protein